MYVFDLPVDVAIKQFKEMNEAFWSKEKKNQTLPNPLFPAALLSKHSLKQTFDLSHLKANTIVVVVLKDVDFLTYIKRWKKKKTQEKQSWKSNYLCDTKTTNFN